MGQSSTKNRQKKIAKRKAKTKMKQKNTRIHGADLGKKMGLAEECWIDDSNQGLCTFILLRRANDGNFWLGSFMVDFFCLGVKNCFLRRVNLLEMRAFVECRAFVPYSAEQMKTAVMTGVEYAKSIGFEPYKDYKSAFKIFNNIEESSVPCEFELGKDGKPFFFAGPFDSPKKCARIKDVLDQTCGEGNYIMTLAVAEFDHKKGRYVGSEIF